MENQKSNEKIGENPLGTGDVKKLLLSFSIPAIIAIVINAAYNITDQIFIGQSVGYLGNAATTVMFPLLTIVMAVASLLGAGATTYSAIKMGERNVEEANNALNCVFLFTLGIGTTLTLLGIVFLEPLLKMAGADIQIMPFAKDYGIFIMLGIPFNMLSMSLSGMTRVDGNPRISMYGMLMGAVLNIALDPIFLFVFKWGVKGAALATIISQLASACLMFYYFTKRSKIMHLQLKKLRLKFDVCIEIIKLGSSSGLTQFVAFIMQLVMNNSLLYYGNQSGITGGVAIGAMGIIMKIMMVLASVCMGLGIGAQPILGFNYGAKNHKRIKETYLKACLYATISITIGWLVCQLIPNTIVHIFGSGNLEFTNFAVRCTHIYLGGIFLVGFEIISTNYFQATKQPLKATILSTLRQFTILVPLLLILPIFMGLDGILFAGLIADILSAIIIALYIIPEMKKLNKKQESELHNVK